jgi:diguanylate cyclase (GGDEF)-like protein
VVVTVVALEGTATAPDVCGPQVALVHADGPLEAARVVSSQGADAILFRGDVGWQRQFVARLPSERRPAAVAVGGSPLACAHFADEWVPERVTPEELRFRLQLAQARGRARRQAARRAFVDPLTGLPNRRAVVRALVRESERARRVGGEVSLVMMDLDDFKRVNEEQGHNEGDRQLRRVGAALRRCTRDNELCGRIGGDEFAAIISAGVAEAQRAARRFQTALQHLGISASVSACEQSPGEPLKALYRRTDAELRAAKVRKHSGPSASAPVPQGGGAGPPRASAPAQRP